MPHLKRRLLRSLSGYRNRRLLLSVALSALLWLVLPVAHGIEMVDPKLRWHTITTDHFQITYHQGEEELARRTAARAELIHRVLTAELEWTPRRRTQIVIIDRQDDPNGYATPLPYNTIVMYATAPDPTSSLDHYEDWLAALLTHEYTHTLHMDTISGLPALARKVMGSIIAPNALQPRWVVEGFAALQETRQTLAGRGASTWTDMVVRMAALENRFPKIDQADGYGSIYPYGQIPYLFGVEFQQWVAKRYGEKGWTAFSKRNGHSPIPYLFNRHARKVFGRSLYQLWDEWRRDTVRSARELELARRQAGLTGETVLSQPDEAVAGVRVSPDGRRVVYSASSPHQAARVFAVDLEDGSRRELDRQRLPTSFTFSVDGSQVYFAAPALYDIYSRYDDLYVYSFEKKKLRRVTRGQRARDPEMSPDGSRLLYVTNRHGQTNLAYTRIDEQVVPLSRDRDFTQYATPRFAPDGQSFVASVWKPGGHRDLFRFSRDGAQLERLTDDRAQDIDPSFTPDGRYLLFSSDRDGVANIYALEVATDTLYRVTNVLGGAFQPCVTPDGQTLVFMSYHARGMVAVKTTFDPAGWVKVERRLPPAPAPAEPPKLSYPGLVAAGAFADVPAPVSKGYNPLPTLPPRFFGLQGYLTEAGAVGGLYTYGTDVLSKHLYSATLSYRTDDHFLGYSASYTNQQTRIPFVAALSSLSVSLGRLPTLEEGAVPAQPGEPAGPAGRLEAGSAPGSSFYESDAASYTYFEVRTQASLGLRLPFSRISQAYIRYLNECRGPLEPIPGETATGGYRGNPFSCPSPLTEIPAGYSAEAVPARGRFAGLSVDYRYSESERYARSVSPEHETWLDVAASVQSRYLGSDYDRAMATAEVRQYLSIPRLGALRNHVLALRLAGGAALGDDLNEPTFRLGGSFGENPAILFPDGYYSLRGYPIGASSGEAFVLGSAEYRFPVWHVDRGLGTWPVFVRSISAAAFADAGRASELGGLSAWGDGKEWRSWLEGVKVGVGGELRADLIVSYGLSVTVRSGLGVALTDGGYIPSDLRGWYLQIGSYF